MESYVREVNRAFIGFLSSGGLSPEWVCLSCWVSPIQPHRAGIVPHNCPGQRESLFSCGLEDRGISMQTIEGGGWKACNEGF